MFHRDSFKLASFLPASWRFSGDSIEPEEPPVVGLPLFIRPLVRRDDEEDEALLLMEVI